MELVVRATVLFWLLWFLIRAGGKRELAEMTPFELIVLMVMGDLIQQGVTQEDMSVTGAALSVSTIALWTVGLSYLNFRHRRVREFLDSTPAIVVTEGVVDEAMLAIHRLRQDDLLDEARNNGIAAVGDIKYAVLEADGKFSFIRRGDETEVAKGDDEPEV